MSAEGNKAAAGTPHRRALLGALAALPVAAGGVAAEHPDAALIAACQEHNRLNAAVNATREDIDDTTPLGAAYFASLDAVSAAEPKTLAGWLAKAEAAQVDADADDDGSLGHQWAWALMQDMQRLVAAGVVR